MILFLRVWNANVSSSDGNEVTAADESLNEMHFWESAAGVSLSWFGLKAIFLPLLSGELCDKPRDC